jgi:amidase
MAVQVPTPDQLRAVAAEMGLSLTGADVESFINLMRPSVAAYNGSTRFPTTCRR